MNPPDDGLTPVSEPKSGTILHGKENYLGGGGSLTVTAPQNESCLVKLKTTSGYTHLCFFVRAGDTVTVETPSLYLYVYFATGDTWYGSEHLFGNGTNYFKDDELCNFLDFTYSYDLSSTYQGNFSETPINADEFE